MAEFSFQPTGPSVLQKSFSWMYGSAFLFIVDILIIYRKVVVLNKTKLFVWVYPTITLRSGILNGEVCLNEFLSWVITSQYDSRSYHQFLPRWLSRSHWRCECFQGCEKGAGYQSMFSLWSEHFQSLVCWLLLPCLWSNQKFDSSIHQARDWGLLQEWEQANGHRDKQNHKCTDSSSSGKEGRGRSNWRACSRMFYFPWGPEPCTTEWKWEFN